MAAHAAVVRQGVLCGFVPSTRSEFFPIPRRRLAVVSTGRRVCKPLVFSAQISVKAHRHSAGGKYGEENNQECFKDAMALIARAPVLPKLVVFDLDYTVWPLYCQYQSTGTDTPVVYPQAVDIIKALAASRIALAVASRTPALEMAIHFMERLSIVEYFSHLEIYLTVFAKTKHFNALKYKTDIPYESMLFFDDETKNVDSAHELGVNTVLVGDGLNLKALEEGLCLVSANSRDSVKGETLSDYFLKLK